MKFYFNTFSSVSISNDASYLGCCADRETIFVGESWKMVCYYSSTAVRRGYNSGVFLFYNNTFILQGQTLGGLVYYCCIYGHCLWPSFSKLLAPLNKMKSFIFMERGFYSLRGGRLFNGGSLG